MIIAMTTSAVITVIVGCKASINDWRVPACSAVADGAGVAVTVTAVAA